MAEARPERKGQKVRRRYVARYSGVGLMCAVGGVRRCGSNSKEETNNYRRNEHKPPTNVARVRYPDPASYMG